MFRFQLPGVLCWLRFTALAVLVGVVFVLPAGPVAAQTEKQDASAEAAPDEGSADAKPQPRRKPARVPDKTGVKPSGVSVDAKSQYRELPTDESLKSSKDRTRAAKILRDGPSGPQDQEWLTDYFKNYSFPRWTLAKNFQSISDFVKEWRQFVANAKGESHKTLLELTMTSMKDFVSDSEYSPAVRYNAILVIGLLNEQEPEGGRKSVLLPEALPILLENLKDPNQIDAVRVGALVGLVRHCQAIGSDPAGNPSVTRELLKIAKESDHAGRSPAGHAWMRVLAIDGLGALKQVGTANEVADALAAIVADKSAKINVRTAAVKALGWTELRRRSERAESEGFGGGRCAGRRRRHRGRITLQSRDRDAFPARCRRHGYARYEGSDGHGVRRHEGANGHGVRRHEGSDGHGVRRHEGANGHGVRRHEGANGHGVRRHERRRWDGSRCSSRGG